MLDLVRTMTREHRDVDLILFGETITGWYSRGADSRQYHQSIAEAIPGKTPAMLSASASEFRVNVCFGMSEASDGKLFNSQVLIDPTGPVIAVHRKVNPQGSKTFVPGPVPVTMADVNGIRTARIICSDIQRPTVRKAPGS
jgi:predicted amidohydrolase